VPVIARHFDMLARVQFFFSPTESILHTIIHTICFIDTDCIYKSFIGGDSLVDNGTASIFLVSKESADREEFEGLWGITKAYGVFLPY